MLVDTNDRPIGTAEKQRAHVLGQLHRAFSVFLYDRAGRMLLQQRALTKYHSPGLWSNACCGHPRPGEALPSAARRRVREELGIDVGLRRAFDFVYRADVGDGLVEHEYDHVLVGEFDGVIFPASAEVANTRFAFPATIAGELARDPAVFTPWFHVAFARLAGRPRL